MKEETNETTNASQPTETEMNGMYQNAWLGFHADAQEAKQDLNRRYAKMVNTFGSYKQMPDGVKEILKEDYAAHKAKWGENGEEQQKRFGANEPEPIQLAGTTKTQPSPEQSQKRQEFLQKMQAQRQPQPSRRMEYER
ncbi:hypothetical protein BDD43_2155 [Mucilaginibacter gracilis]|uniref:Uncharacterized protein n=1 Tax=Mucilaginibacter gracilis TaxID=423350 RepID=A0A495J024_9SPHI|nr:hypothetical protein [Mucilaginibacter gracilis]RKR81991.1 hypothetical protein BDD43_2155 [Mucilaginibacter gracilis]